MSFKKIIEQKFAFSKKLCYYKITFSIGIHSNDKCILDYDYIPTKRRIQYMSQGKITAKQQEILEYIKSCILKKGYPPAVREICEAVHLKSTSSVHSHLRCV